MFIKDIIDFNLLLSLRTYRNWHMEFKRISLSPLNHREYRLYIFVRFFYIMALRMVATVVAYQLFHLTKSSFSIGVVGLSEFIPVFSLALYAGHVIDRSD